MKNFHRVTILGMLLGLGACLFGCAAGQGQLQKENMWNEAKEAKEIEAQLSECLDAFEHGKLDEAQAILREILKKSPGHPDALFYWEKLHMKRYSTVYSGNTLSGIAAYYYDDAEKWSFLARVNGIQSPEQLQPYRRLRIPWLPPFDDGKDEAERLRHHFFDGALPAKIVLHPVREGDTLEALAREHYGDKRLRFFLADYNHLENPHSLKQGSYLRIPFFPERKKDWTKDREILKRGNLALKKQHYERACGLFASIPSGSPYRSEAKRGLARCRAEGASYYERLGDEALKNSDPQDACRYWKMAMRIDPRQRELTKKLEEAQDLVKALDLLPSLP